MYLNRRIEPFLEQYLKSFPVVGIMGPRQSGKSTLLKSFLKSDYEYITFDDLEIRSLFNEDPVSFMRKYDNRVIFDEVQYVPDIFNRIKVLVDNDRMNYGKFVLTGSSQFIMNKHISESLAGRIGLLNLLPFQFSEIPENIQSEAILKGSYPELVVRGFVNSAIWYDSYINTYLQKDLRLLMNVQEISDFVRFMKILAAHTAGILNLSEVSRDLAVSSVTLKRWLSVLEASFIIFLLPPYYQNFSKRIVKSPKVYFYDTGLACYLTGIETMNQLENGIMAGNLFENYIISETVKRNAHEGRIGQFFYYRTSNGVEIDLISEYRGYKELIEIKSNSSYKPQYIKNMSELLPLFDKGKVVYKGENLEVSDKIEAVNFKAYLSSQASEASF